MSDPSSAPPTLESTTTAVGRPMRILANLLVVVTAVVGLVLLLVLLIGQNQRANRLAEGQRELEIALVKTRKDAATIATAQADRIKNLETRIQRLEQLGSRGSHPRQPVHADISDILPTPAAHAPEAAAARAAITESRKIEASAPQELERGNSTPPRAPARQTPTLTPADQPTQMQPGP